MQISLHWLNQYLASQDNAPIAASEAESVLMDMGLPIETRKEFGDDIVLDVEITSNRGDCLSHVGIAREIAARTGRTLTLPKILALPFEGPAVAESLEVENRAPDACPLFTARVIRGVKVGPSPAWLVRALDAVGQRSINSLVDATNFLNFELGQPTHVFDLRKLAGQTLVIRYAAEGEKLTSLDGKARVLKSNELVVADAQRAQSLAGVIGGQDSEVDLSTTDVVLEAATWDPVTVRRAARRLQVRTDASHRFERIVDPRTIRFAADRLASLILELAGGTLCSGIIEVGKPLEPLTHVGLRPARVSAVLGVQVGPEEIVALLTGLGIACTRAADRFDCTIPPHRPDLTREIDLIEEIARARGLGKIDVADMLPVRVRPPQPAEVARRELGRVLTSLGFYETVTFSFVRPDDAALYATPGTTIINVDDDRRGSEPTLRPSLLPSLLACRRANQDAKVAQAGGVRLFEIASAFGPPRPNAPTERRVLGLLLDVPGEGSKRSIADLQSGIRILRGTIDSILSTLGGTKPCIEILPAQSGTLPQALDADSSARVVLHTSGGQPVDIGFFGLLSKAALQRAGLDTPVVVAQLDVEPLVALYPPKARVASLPAFPGIERDLSLILKDEVSWASVSRVAAAQKADRMEGVEYVYTYRGKPLNPGTKSVTLRLKFRDDSRTLRHEEVDPQIAQLVAAFGKELGATLRA
jgi:phenylalanyl-tRNA synthetase beta chain